MLRLPSPSVTRTHHDSLRGLDVPVTVETPIPVGDEDAHRDPLPGAFAADVETPIPVGDEDAQARV